MTIDELKALLNTARLPGPKRDEAMARLQELAPDLALVVLEIDTYLWDTLPQEREQLHTYLAVVERP